MCLSAGGVATLQQKPAAHESSRLRYRSVAAGAAHVGSAREPRVRINSTRIWPHAVVRQIYVVFDIFRLVHPKAHLGFVVCEGLQVCSEKQYDTGQ